MKLHDLVDEPSKLKTHGKYVSDEEAYERLKKGENNPALVEAVAKNAKWAFYYARDILHKRFPEGERAIASDPEFALRYAKDVIQGKFPEGEKAIASSPIWSYNYVRDVIKQRFPEGEKAIASNPMYAKLYKQLLKELKK